MSRGTPVPYWPAYLPAAQPGNEPVPSWPTPLADAAAPEPEAR